VVHLLLYSTTLWTLLTFIYKQIEYIGTFVFNLLTHTVACISHNYLPSFSLWYIYTTKSVYYTQSIFLVPIDHTSCQSEFEFIVRPNKYYMDFITEFMITGNLHFIIECLYLLSPWISSTWWNRARNLPLVKNFNIQIKLWQTDKHFK